MASNPYVNKVEYAGQTVMDISGDTVTPSDVLNGVTFHDRSGAPQTGAVITHNVYDGLDSTSTSDALSANQGTVLNSKINNKFTWKIFLTASNVSVGNTFASTGKSFTLAKYSLVRVDMSYGSGRPLAIGLKLSESASSGTLALTSIVSSDISDTSGLSVTVLLTAGTYYIWARTASATGSTNLLVQGIELGA